MWVIHPVYDRYMVSDKGEVRHVSSDKVRAQRYDKYGYMRINIGFNGKCKTLKVHTLVADCFVLNPHDLLTVNHKDGNKSNNLASNLEWMSAKDNVSDSYNRPHKKCNPVYFLGSKYRSLREASRVTGVNRVKIGKLTNKNFQLED